jgi:inner membrane protein
LDNLTHSLAGALLGQMGLKRLSGRAMATLVIAANLPDIDAFASVLGTESLAIRRGITHGPLGMLLLPPLLTGLVLLWNRWRPAAQPVRPAALLLLAYLGTLSHPALDWLNSYGVRLLEPFSSRWFAGDTLFIIDVWIWLALIASVWISIRRERRGGEWRRPALAGFAAICLYILANGLITGRAEAQSREILAKRSDAPELVVANPVPVTFWKRNMLWRNPTVHGAGTFDLLSGAALGGSRTPNGLDHRLLTSQRARPDIAAFLFWSRMPIVKQADGHLVLTDQRFADSPVRTTFLIPLGPERR